MTTFSILGDDVTAGIDPVLGLCINGKPIFMIPEPYLKSVLAILKGFDSPIPTDFVHHAAFVYHISEELYSRTQDSRGEVFAVGKTPSTRKSDNDFCASDEHYRIFALVMSDILKFSVPLNETSTQISTGYFDAIYSPARIELCSAATGHFFQIEVGPPGIVGTGKWFKEKKEFNNWHSAIIHIIDKYWKNP